MNKRFNSLIFVGLIMFCSGSFAKEPFMGAHMMNSIIVDVEDVLVVNFTDVNTESFVVNPTGASKGGRPAIIRITGNPSEIMVSVEKDTISGDDKENLQGLKISDFDVLQRGAGRSVGLMPFSDEDSFLLTIGGKVTKDSKFEEFYSGVNILSVNYL